jgi:hypothetical protein
MFRFAEKKQARASKRGTRSISYSNAKTTTGEIEMTKLIAFTAALVVFVPVAIAALSQAALIVA